MENIEEASPDRESFYFNSTNVEEVKKQIKQLQKELSVSDVDDKTIVVFQSKNVIFYTPKNAVPTYERFWVNSSDQSE